MYLIKLNNLYGIICKRKRAVERNDDADTKLLPERNDDASQAAAVASQHANGDHASTTSTSDATATCNKPNSSRNSSKN